MRVIGFGFTKVSAEKLSETAKDLKLDTNIDISSIEDIKSEVISSKEALLGIKFTFGLNYEPNFAKIELKGSFLVELEKDKAKEIVKQWQEKKLSEDDQIDFLNLILRKSHVRAIQLEEELGIPFHFQPPTLGKKE